MDKPKLGIREIRPKDASFINRYWADATDADLERMGEHERPNADENTAYIEDFCSKRVPPEKAEEAIAVWLVNDISVGYSTLKDIKFGDTAQTHLHMCYQAMRRQGIGSVLFCLSVQKFLKDFQLKKLYCQPEQHNPMPNGMLRKIGFPLLETVEWTHPQDHFVVRQNKYLVSIDLVQKHLASVRDAFSF